MDIYISSQINYGNTNFPNNENSTEETYFKGINALINSEDFEGLVECLMEIIKRFKNSSDRNSNKLYVEALFHKGLFLSKIEK